MKILIIFPAIVGFSLIAMASEKSIGNSINSPVLLSQSLSDKYQDMQSEKKEMQEEVKKNVVGLFYCAPTKLNISKDDLIDHLERHCPGGLQRKFPGFCNAFKVLGLRSPGLWQETPTVASFSLNPNSSNWKGIEGKGENSLILESNQKELNIDNYDYYRLKSDRIEKYKCHDVGINFSALPY